MTTLETTRLLLRQFRESDLDQYAAICSDAEVMRYLGGKPHSRAETWRTMAMVLGHWQLRGYGMWAAEERSSGLLVGRVGFNHHEGWPGFEIGWTLGRPYWGKGYATEGARSALKYAFTDLGQKHVISLIHPENTASIRVAERLGERLERIVEHFGMTVGVYGISRKRWSSALLSQPG
jgi:RimJ/RimL family protein N-acetyltransferase